MSKETLARAANSTDLGMEADVVHDVDRLMAMACGDTLGSLLLRFRESGQSQWGHRIVLILARRLKDQQHLGRDIAVKVAAAALEEFAQDHCSECHGARQLVLDKLTVVCSACDGSGKERWSNAARRERIGAYGARIDAGMESCHRWMGNAVGALLAHASARLA